MRSRGHLIWANLAACPGRIWARFRCSRTKTRSYLGRYVAVHLPEAHRDHGGLPSKDLVDKELSSQYSQQLDWCFSGGDARGVQPGENPGRSTSSALIRKESLYTKEVLMRISWMTTLLGLLADAALLAMSLVSSEIPAWLVTVRLALFAVQVLEFLVVRQHPKGTDHRRAAPHQGGSRFIKERALQHAKQIRMGSS